MTVLKTAVAAIAILSCPALALDPGQPGYMEGQLNTRTPQKRLAEEKPSAVMTDALRLKMKEAVADPQTLSGKTAQDLREIMGRLMQSAGAPDKPATDTFYGELSALYNEMTNSRLTALSPVDEIALKHAELHAPGLLPDPQERQWYVSAAKYLKNNSAAFDEACARMALLWRDGRRIHRDELKTRQNEAYACVLKIGAKTPPDAIASITKEMRAKVAETAVILQDIYDSMTLSYAVISLCAAISATENAMLDIDVMRAKTDPAKVSAEPLYKQAADCKTRFAKLLESISASAPQKLLEGEVKTFDTGSTSFKAGNPKTLNKFNALLGEMESIKQNISASK